LRESEDIADAAMALLDIVAGIGWIACFGTDIETSLGGGAFAILEFSLLFVALRLLVSSSNPGWIVSGIICLSFLKDGSFGLTGRVGLATFEVDVEVAGVLDSTECGTVLLTARGCGASAARLGLCAVELDVTDTDTGGTTGKGAAWDGSVSASKDRLEITDDGVPLSFFTCESEKTSSSWSSTLACISGSAFKYVFHSTPASSFTNLKFAACACGEGWVAFD
jgi:hypothetical protein